jgi:hypothetical protein
MVDQHPPAPLSRAHLRNDAHRHRAVLLGFASPRSRTTIAFPLYWRFADDTTVSLLAGQTYYRERKLSNGLDWELHVFPAFSYGETPDGHWWNILFGLAGYTRRGRMTQARALWIPMTLTSPAGAE